MGRMPDGMVNSRKENKIMLKSKRNRSRVLNVEESTLSETTSFKEDLGADSLDLLRW